MNNTVKIMITAAALLGSVEGFGQKLNQMPSFNLLTLADTTSSAQVADMQKQLKELDAQIAAQSKKLNNVYRDIPIDKELELNLREDSIYMSMLSKRCVLTTKLAETKKHSVQGMLNRLNARPQQNNAAANSTAIPSKPTKPTKPSKPNKKK